MIRGLIKLAVYGLVGYAAYHFFTDVSSMIEERGNEQSRGRKRGGRGGARGGGQAQMTGKAKVGKTEETAESDGGSVRHRVGRGVL